MSPAEKGALAAMIDDAVAADPVRRELLEALRKCLEYIPCSEVRNWPPGFELKRKALAAARAAIAKAEGQR